MKKAAFLIVFVSILLNHPACFSATISGRVLDESGTPVAGLPVQVFSTKCSGEIGWESYTDNEGYYSVGEIPANSSYYVKACPSCNHKGYINQWYAEENGQTNCHLAQQVNVTDEQDDKIINFVLKKAPRRLQYFQLVVRNDQLKGDFAVLPGFQGLLQNAVIRGPGGFQYTFDLQNDRLEWNNECRCLQGYAKWLGDNFQYGDYTLTLTFADGVQKAYTKTLVHVTLPSVVNENTMSCTVNDDGGVVFQWTPPDTSLYYQIRIRNSDGSVEYYRSPTTDGTVTSLEVSPYSLRCLEIGKKYYWFVRAYDSANYYSNWINTYNAISQTPYVQFTYNPSNLTGRVSWANIYSKNEKTPVSEFSVRYGSRTKITQATISGPGYSSSFDLQNGFFDLSSPTRFNYWWQHVMPEDLAEGDYRFNISFSDGYIESLTTPYRKISLVNVNSNTLKTQILDDGAIYFSWQIPDNAPSQKYQIKIRNGEGTKEFFKSVLEENMTGLTVTPWLLRALEPGKSYQWFVRIYPSSSGYSSRRQTKSAYFLYNPFGIKAGYDPEGDKDVDGQDLINYIEKGDFSDLASFAASFGLSG